MPRTRQELDRETKVDEILEAAVRRLGEGGYEALSVAGIARELGVAQNAIYWYFPSRDHLFVAALGRMLREIMARKPPRQRSLERKVLWFVDQLQEIEPVRAAMYERARTSPVVAEFAEELNGTWRRMLSNVLATRLDEPERTAAVDALIATIQGAFFQPMSAAERRRLIAFALERLAPPAGIGVDRTSA
jgi:TetR/AcrR family transcriptional regulator, cholesterol catabolism regulator